VYGLKNPKQVTSYDDFVESVKKMRTAYKVVRDNIGVAAERNKKYYDLRAKPMSFSVGQYVYYYNPRKRVGHSDKCQRKYTGPFRVEKMLSPVNVLLRKSKKSQPFVAHVDKVKECYESGELCEEPVQLPVVDDKDCEASPRRLRRQVQPPRRLIAESA